MYEQYYGEGDDDYEDYDEYEDYEDYEYYDMPEDYYYEEYAGFGDAIQRTLSKYWWIFGIVLAVVGYLVGSKGVSGIKGMFTSSGKGSGAARRSL